MLQNVAGEKVKVPKRKSYKTLTSQSTYYSQVLTFCDVHVLERLCFESVRFRNCYVLKLCYVWRIRNVYPGSRILSFTHFGSPIQKYQQKTVLRRKWFVKAFLLFTNLPKLRSYFIFYMLKKKFSQIFPELLNFLRKLSPTPQKVFVSVIWDPGKRYSGSRFQDSKMLRIQDPGFGSATLVTVPYPLGYNI